MSKKMTIVITGASDGIGAAATRRLHADGHTVVAVGRSADKTRAIGRELGIQTHVADFTRLHEVERLAAELAAAHPRIDVLVNNAGGVFGARTVTGDGFEKTFQVNVLAPVLLTRLLLDTLVTSRASVVQTSSTVRFAGTIDLDDLGHERNYEPARAYSAAKLENILFTTELHRRYHAAGISAASFYPGNVSTNFASETTNPIMRAVRFLDTRTPFGSLLLSTPAEGADQIVWLATGTPGIDWHSGSYYYKRRASTPRNAQARDADFARRFWERTESLLAGHLTNRT
ncbi:SDR family NAD(P)-dependent oxidoreductase [Myceligenerans pegani]|uniref:SDR family NAD(P)-dependent oxidoreductase n=1 Tax=Myceligenerans pegani TaxID=2776917 RepID=A0ABR9N5P6_9MICO|nr:SDR family NAD(P)-dependent oxidoreductase [Myceligenerans sp. TRM 65318]MBE1878454.1 SDR family NAD(P)-dependent oxidoreductase [Myceligenerans sp. TRM 65318]MBE3020725.1 SDR family NAD(P)-dependent oxidoreductase [Myceligenerans sp. TRM 65318]